MKCALPSKYPMEMVGDADGVMRPKFRGVVGLGMKMWEMISIQMAFKAMRQHDQSFK